MKNQPLSPEDKAHLREILNSAPAKRWMAALVALRPPISGRTGEERSLSASEAMGYERAVGNMAQLLEDLPPNPEIRSVNIRTD
jgi:hypothetical protein